MQPSRITQPDLLGVQEELIQREPLFHRPELGTSRHDFEAMIADDFWETGASGRRYSREFVLETVLQRYSGPHEDQWRTEEFYCQCVSLDHYLLTYTLHQGPRVTRRATLWRRVAHRWVALYHHGTLVAEA
jgi:hypothetical protein